jgi:predicted Zn-dependent protease
MVAGVIIATNGLLMGCQIFPTQADNTISQRVHPLLQLADAHIGRGDLTAALPLIIQAEQIAPASMTVALKRAEILERQGDQAEAQRILERLDRQEPEVSHAYARFLNKIGQRAKAIGVLAVACDAIDYPHRFEALQLRTQLLIASHRFLEAGHDLDRLSRMKTGDPSIQLVRVQVLLKSGRVREALEVYQAINRSVKTGKLAQEIERDFRRLAKRLKIVGRDFGPYDF